MEFSQPSTVINGIFGCSFIGQEIQRYTLTKVSDSPNGSWARSVEGSGCGQWGARRSLDKQFASLQQRCSAQSGIGSTTSKHLALCTPPDPNDLSCGMGCCRLQGKFTCKISD